MKATMYIPGRNEPVALFDEVRVIEMNDNHKESPYRIYFKSSRLNASKVMVELQRDMTMALTLEDGRSCRVLLQHSSLDMEGKAVGVLRVLGDFSEN